MPNNDILDQYIKICPEERTVYIQSPLVNIPKNDFSLVVDKLYEVSDICSYAVYNPEYNIHKTVTVLFCGFLERFRTISLLKEVDGPFIVIQDSVSPWFTGSKMCLGINEVKDKILAFHVKPSKLLIVGQSSGGYAALYLSRKFEKSTCISFAPQTFDDYEVKHKNICFPPRFKPSLTLSHGGLIEDLRCEFFKKPNRSKSDAFIVAAFSEHNNPPTEWLWLDAMHWGRIIDHPDVLLFLTEGSRHPVLLGNVEKFSMIIRTLSLNLHDDEFHAREYLKQTIHLE